MPGIFVKFLDDRFIVIPSSFAAGLDTHVADPPAR